MRLSYSYRVQRGGKKEGVVALSHQVWIFLKWALRPSAAASFGVSATENVSCDLDDTLWLRNADR